MELLYRATQVKLVNTNLVWETKETVNIGFDASFLNSRLTFSAEYYHSKTKDVLTEMPIAISTGNQEGAPKANAASLRNRGFELSFGVERSSFRFQIWCIVEYYNFE